MKKRTIAIVLAELDHLYEINADDDMIIRLEEELDSLMYYNETRRFFEDVYYA